MNALKLAYSETRMDAYRKAEVAAIDARIEQADSKLKMLRERRDETARQINDLDWKRTQDLNRRHQLVNNNAMPEMPEPQLQPED